MAKALYISLTLYNGSLALEAKLGQNDERRRCFHSNIRVNHPEITLLYVKLLLWPFSCWSSHRHTMILGVKFLSALEKLCARRIYTKKNSLCVIYRNKNLEIAYIRKQSRTLEINLINKKIAKYLKGKKHW